MTERFIRPSDIPKSIWDGKDTLSLPQSLGEAYCRTLKTLGLFEEARHATSSGAIGGKSKEETVEHFVYSFIGSCVRLELAILDPKNVLTGTSDYFLNAFSGGRVRLLDIPCGCGAASAALLATVAELRRQNIIPREPLDVFVTGGDVSETARCYANILYSDLQHDLHSQGIFVKSTFYPWDITESNGTKDILNEWLADSADGVTPFLLIANFSSFLGDQNNRNKAEEQIGVIFDWAETNKCSVAWIEPPMNEETSVWVFKFFRRIVNKIKDLLGRPEGMTQRRITKLNFWHPLQGSRHQVRIEVGGLGGQSR